MNLTKIPFASAMSVVLVLAGCTHETAVVTGSQATSMTEVSGSAADSWPKLQDLDLNDRNLYSSYSFRLRKPQPVEPNESQHHKIALPGYIWASNTSPQVVYATYGEKVPVFGVWNRHFWVCNGSLRTLTLADDIGFHLTVKFSISEKIPKHGIFTTDFTWRLLGESPSEVNIDVPGMFRCLVEGGTKSREGNMFTARAVKGPNRDVIFTAVCEVGAKGGYPFHSVSFTYKDAKSKDPECYLLMDEIEVNKAKGEYSMNDVERKLRDGGFIIRHIPNATENEHENEMARKEIENLIGEAAYAGDSGDIDAGTLTTIKRAFSRGGIPGDFGND